MTENNIKVKPFLRWAGGKRWLLKDLPRLLPEKSFKNFHEPFLGGGAIFFFLEPKKKSFLSDLNKELIETYHSVQDDIENVISDLLSFKNTEEDYYKIRNKKFVKSSRKAAQFIYLNQTSFNGIYRVNSRGQYNVPYGHRKNYRLDIENLRLANIALKNCKIAFGDFTDTIKNVNAGDLVFLDPPYTVTHNENGFVSYNQKLFSLQDQYRLANTISEIKEIGAYYILTNAAHEKVREIFNNKDKVIELKRASSIGGKNATRGQYSELIITNTI
ncbi:DNA adenine methylase [Ferruginibacter albus]|uniref:DNA adenine methylase n=1 Tax=Ferruginibacter albus TaxID=2875540 RepID=UPI001CC3B5DF|nr:Dam family site-specific DNA-(adenine-N6)-methyltransferase [Ferruginibacter albus]UAY51283.1 Dam family site-specific DNA-(adenine-N6)-methyltransferase [Ferruginibacter albus]